MAQLYYCPAIVFGATTFWLPPWIVWNITRSQTVELQTPAQTNHSVITSVRPNQGARISLTAAGVKDEQSQASVLAWFEEIWQHLSGEDKQFDFFLYNDRAWPECALETQTEGGGLEPMIVLQDMQLDIICPHTQPDLTKHISFIDFNAEYPYANKVGRPLGDAADPETVVTIMNSVQTLPGTFYGGQYVPTATGQDQVFTVGGAPGSQWQLISTQVTWADPVDSTGTSTVRVSTVPKGSSGPQVDATVAAGAFFGTQSTAAIIVTAGDELYSYVQTGGGHQNIQYVMTLKAL